MPEFGFLDGQPFWIVYFTLLGVILCRAQATYWIGRGLGAGVTRSRVGARLGPRLDAARRRIDRYGAPVVTLSFCTVGVQTAVNLSAGAMRMRFPRYLAAMFVGCLIWAGLWGVIIGGVVGTWLELFLGSPWTALGVVAAAGVLVGVLVLRGRRARSSARRADDDRTGGSPASSAAPAEAEASDPRDERGDGRAQAVAARPA